MAHKSFKEDSRRPWGYDADERTSTLEEVNTGCLQRIADACEVMAKDRVQMERDLKYYKDLYYQYVGKVNSRDKTISTLKGHITRLKKQLSVTNQITQ